MVIISTVIAIIILTVTQTNPILFVRDNFFIGKSQAGVLGVSEENEINKIQEGVTITSNQIVEDEELSNNGLPEAGFRDARPIKKFNTAEEPDITARSAVAIDVKTKKVLFDKNATEISSIASITKLMTAMVALGQNPDFNKQYIVKDTDRRDGGRIFVFQGDIVTTEDLFNISLVGSANTATIALVHSIGMTEQEFVVKMNEKARELGLEKTNFADPVGLSANNKSTAFEIAEILDAALANDKIRETVLQKNYVLQTGQGKQRLIETTDNLLSEKNDYKILGGKTGYLGSAGFCFTGKFSHNDHEIITVVLGSDGVDLRFSDTDKLVSWVYDNYIWP
ncbi:MAG: serine hydrolase [Patescibacteria group bacterium]|jgi:D-alanyl-D-alanine carboxypeptidase